MEHLTFSHIAWDTWNATRGRMSAIKARQQRRLNELVAFVRINSCYYADKYRHLPDHITDVQQLPPTMKPDLLKYFDDWMTDPEVRRADVEAFVSDRSLIGHLFRGQYFVCTTSGTTGVPSAAQYLPHPTRGIGKPVLLCFPALERFVRHQSGPPQLGLGSHRCRASRYVHC